MRFDVSSDATPQAISKTNHYYLFGLVPSKKVDLAEYCPGGTAAVVEETTFLNGLCRAVTLGIWSPRTSRYYCHAGAA